MEIEIKNCNNIDYAKIKIDENKLNVKYALNGTGKSTIANAIYDSIVEPEKLLQLKPFKYKDADSIVPEIKIDKTINNVKIFNEKYISNFVYKKDELLNSKKMFKGKNESDSIDFIKREYLSDFLQSPPQAAQSARCLFSRRVPLSF